MGYKVLICTANLFSSNRGINALTICMLDLINEKYPELEKTLLLPYHNEIMDFSTVEKKFNVKITYFYPLNLLISNFFLNVLKLIPFGKEFFIKRIRILDLFNNHDTIICMNEGDSFTDAYGNLDRFYYYISPMEIAIKLKKRLILPPQTIGPFNSLYGNYKALNILKKTNDIYIRDQISSILLKKILPNKIFHESFDLAFCLKPDKPKKYNFNFSYIAININGLLWNSNQKFYKKSFNINLNQQNFYQFLIHQLISFFLEHSKYKIILIPHTYDNFFSIDNDLYPILEIEKLFKNPQIITIKEKLTANELKYIISHSDFFIGSRMHACIAAISSLVPFFVIGYSHKFNGILFNLGLEEYGANLTKYETPNELFVKIINIFQKRDEIREKLKKKSYKFINEIYSINSWFDNIEKKPEINRKIRKNLTIDVILKNDFCAGCGMCYSLCPNNAISLSVQERNYVRINHEICNNCGICMKVCPSSYYNQAEYNLTEKYSPNYGNYLKVCYGYSNNQNLRFLSSSGGIIKQTILFLIENKIVDYVITLKKNPLNPLEPSIEFFNKSSQILEISNSIYSPISMCSIFKDIEKFRNRKIAFIGKPCEIIALTAAQKLNPILKEAVILKIGLLCNHTPNRNALKKILKKKKISEDKIKSLQYRGDGWPGFFRIEYEDGKSFSLNYQNSWVSIIGAKQFNHKRCELCPDFAADYADFAVGDFQDIKGIGNSFIIIRSKFGLSLMKDMVSKNEISIKDFNSKKLETFQIANIIKKKYFLNYIFIEDLFNIPKFFPKSYYIYRQYQKMGFSSILGIISVTIELLKSFKQK